MALQNAINDTSVTKRQVKSALCEIAQGENIMLNKIFTHKLAILVLIASLPLSAEEASKQYGEKGDFELSAGLSIMSTNFSQYSNNYSIGLLPYANHFLWTHVFLRYDLGFIFNYTKQSSFPDSYALAIQPGLAAGYNFHLYKEWQLNISLGYLATIAWLQNAYQSLDSYASHHLALYPELKYLITPNWSISILTSVISSAGSVGTSTYVAVSRIF